MDATVKESVFLNLTVVPTSLASDLRIPPPPAVASAAGGWGIRRSRLVHSVGYGGISAGAVVEVVMAAVWSVVAAAFPSRAGVPWSSFVWWPSSSRSSLGRVAALGVPRPDPVRRIRSIKVVEKMLSSATVAALRRVGSADPAIGDFPAASGLTPVQGVKRSSGSGAPPTASVRRSRRDLEEGHHCNFLFSSGFVCKIAG